MLTHEQEDQINAYAQNLSLRICREAFEGRDTVYGKDLIELTSVQQVNYFVLKVLYRSWQSEMLRIESPYFNYEQPEVRQALHDFMNTLSRHIEVKEVAFQPLLRQACSDTLYLILSPEEFFRAELVTSVSMLSATYLRNTKKYLCINVHVLDAFIERFEAEEVEEVTPTRSANLLEACAEELRRVEDPAPYLAALAELFPLPQALSAPSPSREYLPREDTKAPAHPSNKEGTSSRSASVDEQEEVEERSPAQESASEHEQESSEAMRLEDHSAPNDDERSSSDVPSAPPPSKKAFRVRDEEGNIIKGEEEDVIRVLFGNKVELYQQATQEIASCGTFDEAIKMLFPRYGRPRGWNLGGKEAKALFRAIYLYFR